MRGDVANTDDGLQCGAKAARIAGCDCLGRRWTCKGCKRFVPYCNGGHAGDPETDDLCDQCWAVVMEQRAETPAATAGGAL